MAYPYDKLSPLNKIITAIIMLSVTLTIIESEPLFYKDNDLLFMSTEMIFGSLFLIEYLCRLWVAPLSASELSPARARWRFATSPAGIIDFLALTPLILPFVGAEAYTLRFLRLLRIVRLSKAGRFSMALNLLVDAVHARRFELAASLVIGAVLLVFSATLLYVVEGAAQPETFGSIPRAMWWSIATLTTVGYGDVTPVTPLGQLCAGAIAILGIGVIAMPTGILAAAFSDALQARRRSEKTEPAAAIAKENGS
jgi:voltage-gated potassium channel